MLDFLKELQNAENSVKSDSTTEALQAVFKVLEQTKKHLLSDTSKKFHSIMDLIYTSMV